MGAPASTVVSLGELTVRYLPPDEWESVLRQIPLFADGKPLPNPQTTYVVVAQRQDGSLAGFWFVFAAYHVEPVWVAEDCRQKAGLLRRMWRGVGDILRALKQGSAYAVILDADLPTGIASQATRMGFQQIPGKLYFVNVNEVDPPKSSVDRTMSDRRE